MIFRRICQVACLSVVALALSIVAARAETEAQIKQRVNAGNVSVITDGLEDTSKAYAMLASDLVSVLNEERKLRIVPLMGDGAIRNIEDLLYLRGVDLAMVHSDVLAHLRLENRLPAAQRRLRYITKLYDKQFHLVARRGVPDAAGLSGLPVAVGPAGSGADVSSRTLLTLMGLEVEAVNLGWQEAAEQLRNGRIAAILVPARKPAKLVTELAGHPELHMLSLPEPGARVLETYTPAELDSTDYPGLIDSGEPVRTLSLSAILAVFNWKPGAGARYRGVTTFVDSLFENVELLRGDSYDPSWTHLRIEEDVKGWKRYPHAQAFIDTRLPRTNVVATAGPAQAADVSQFRRFAEYMRDNAGLNSASERELLMLFAQFHLWKNKIDNNQLPR